MRLRWIAAGLSWLLLGPPAAVSAPVWQTRTIKVYDYTSEAWDGVIAQTVADFNAMLPKAAPQLRYRRMTAALCDDVSWKQRGIIACSSTETDVGGRIRGRSGSTGAIHARVELSDANPSAARHNIACHEFMHAVVGAVDNYGAYPDTSCVWGNLSSPGPADIAYAHKRYKQSDRDQRRH